MRLGMIALGVAIALSGCGSGDSLVVVTVDANPPVANVALLHTTSMAGGMTIGHDFPVASVSLGGGATTTFGVQLPSAINGAFSIHVEADDSAGKALGAGDGTTTITRGGRVDLRVSLGSQIGAMGHVCTIGTDTLDDGCTVGP